MDRVRCLSNSIPPTIPSFPAPSSPIPIRHDPSPFFQACSSDIIYTITLTLQESLLGFSRAVTLPHFKCRTLEIFRDEITPHGMREVYLGLGSIKPQPDLIRGESIWKERGSLVLVYYVRFPLLFSPGQKRMLNKVLNQQENSGFEERQ